MAGNGGKKELVERCLRVTPKRLVRGGVTQLRSPVTGDAIVLEHRRTRQGTRRFVRLRYSLDNKRHRYRIELIPDRTAFGVRWWFACPLQGCGRRTRMLYLPPGESFFGCRSCHNLTYLQTQRPWAGQLVKLGKLLSVFASDLDSANEFKRRYAVGAIQAMSGDFKQLAFKRAAL